MVGGQGASPGAGASVRAVTPGVAQGLLAQLHRYEEGR
jgi:hypothetical protein